VVVIHGKRHDNVLRLINSRVANAGEWGVLNFEETTCIGETGEAYGVSAPLLS
jgi:phage regulator Rha-like protein